MTLTLRRATSAARTCRSSQANALLVDRKNFGDVAEAKFRRLIVVLSNALPLAAEHYAAMRTAQS